MKKIMIFLSLSLFLFSNVITNPFVSIPDGTNAGIINPAGLAVFKGYSLRFDFENSDTSLEGKGNIYFRGGNFSVHTNWGSADYSRHIAFGSEILKRNLLMMGTSIRFDNAGRHLDLGFLSRPNKWISVGGVWRNLYSTNDSNSLLQAGVAIRPFAGYQGFTVFGSGEYTEDMEFDEMPWNMGFQTEVIKGLRLVFTFNRQEEFSLGFESSFGHITTGTEQYFSDENRIQRGNSYIRINSENQHSVIPDNRRLMNLNFGEKISEDPPKILFFREGIKFYDLVYALKKGLNERIPEYFFLNLNGYNLNWAQTEEIRELLKDYRRRGTVIFTFSENLTDLSYFLACVADEIFLLKGGYFQVDGLSAQVPFFHNTLEKLGIEVDIEYEGDYKSAVELILRTDMSDENREARLAILNQRINQYYLAVSEGRNIPLEEVKSLIDSGPYMSDVALRAGLVDRLLYYDELRTWIDSASGGRSTNILSFASEKYRDDSWTEKPKIALVIAEGSIVSGESGYNPIPLPLIGGQYMGSHTVAGMLRTARCDDDIKAVVFRIHSPGGSSLASEVIWREVELTSYEKPVIVSFGSIAGSGGYHIACNATRIFCDRSTITGSIGVITMKPVLGEMYEKLGITFDTVSTNSNSLYWSIIYPMTEDQRDKMDYENLQSYHEFVQMVSQGREMDFDSVDALAQGRIWSGDTAVIIGLADEIGGLDRALEYTGDLIGLTNWQDAEIVINPGSAFSFEVIKNDVISLLNPNIIDFDKLFQNYGNFYYYDPVIEYLDEME